MNCHPSRSGRTTPVLGTSAEASDTLVHRLGSGTDSESSLAVPLARNNFHTTAKATGGSGRQRQLNWFSHSAPLGPLYTLFLYTPVTHACHWRSFPAHYHCLYVLIQLATANYHFRRLSTHCAKTTSPRLQCIVLGISNHSRNQHDNTSSRSDHVSPSRSRMQSSETQGP